MTNDNHPKYERTLVLVKPDGVQRSLIGEVVGRHEKVGLKLVGMKMVLADEGAIEKHYTVDPNWKKNVGEKTIEAYKKKGTEPPSQDPVEVGDTVLTKLKSFMTSGPMVAMVWQGAHAVEVVRKLVGATEPLSSGFGTIRGDFVMDSYQMADTDERAVRNIVHASGSQDEAQKEIAHWFGDDEILNYNLAHEKILYDVELKDILE